MINFSLSSYVLLVVTLFLSVPLTAVCEDMAQTQIVEFPHLGKCEIQARSIDNNRLPIVQILNSNKSIIFQAEMGKPFELGFFPGAGIEFQVRHIKGLPDPLIVVVSAGQGGSASPLDVVIIGAVSGRIQLLWKTPAMTTDDGLFIGNLGGGSGIGIAVWRRDEDDTCHLCPHHFSLQLFPWDNEKSHFCFGSVLNTAGKHKEEGNALQELGFGFRNQLTTFTKLKRYF